MTLIERIVTDFDISVNPSDPRYPCSFTYCLLIFHGTLMTLIQRIFADFFYQCKSV